MIVISFPIGVFVFISTPNRFIFSISLFKMLRGRRYSGIPRASIPPGTFEASKMVGLNPSSAKKYAAERPLGPDPIIATRSSRAVTSGTGRERISTWSAANLFSSLIDTGSSTSQRRHSCSQNRTHTLPRVPGRGASRMIISIASLYLRALIMAT